MSDARLSVRFLPVQIQGPHFRIVSWIPVTLQDTQPIYKLFMQWRNNDGRIYNRLLCEGNRTSCKVGGSLPLPHRMYVNVIVKKPVHNFEEGNILTNPTENVLLPVPEEKPTKPARASGNSTTGNSTTFLKVEIVSYDWNFVNLSWNAIETGNSHVTYRVTARRGNKAIDLVTPKKSMALSSLKQLTRYEIKVQALENNSVPLASAAVSFITGDRNECKEMPDPCFDRAQCINTKGSYFCRCPLGWTFDGKVCKELSQHERKGAFCDAERFLNIIWPVTSQGQMAFSWCPVGSRGIAKRQCLEVFGESTSEWDVPDLSECVSDKMINIAQQLDDPDVDVTEISMQLVNATDVNTHAQAPLQAGDLKLVVDLIEKISQKSLGTMQYLPPAIRDETIKKITKAIVKSSSNILDDKALESWKFMPEDSRAAGASKLLKGVDGIALHLAKTAVASNAIVSEASNVVLSAKSISDVKPNAQRMPPTSKIMRNLTSSTVLLPGSVLMQQRNEGNQGMTQYITFVSYRNLEALMQPSADEKSSNSTEDESGLGKIESEITSVSLHPMKINSFEDPVIITMKSKQNNDKLQANCVFWNVSGPRGFWSQTGCHLKERNSSHTTCQCYHLTSFAVLMRITDMPENDTMEKHKFTLSLISLVGISISVAALALAFLTFAFLRFRNTRHRYFVHANLALSLGMAETLFLFGITKTANKLICKIIAITLHYLFLVSFCWMAVEGVVLYLLLVKIFRTKTRPARDRTVFFTFSWGIPVIVVAVSAVPFYEGYGTEEFCWLSIERHSTWAFVGPVLLICLFNFVCLGKTFMIMAARGRTKKEDTSIEKIRYWSKGCALLSCLLGLTWILGVFVVNQDTIFMAYLFNIFNTLQGLFIFVFHCIGDEKVRAEYLRIIRCQTRAQAYGVARPWWSKSDSLSRSRTWEERQGKVYRRSTLQSNIDCSKPQGSIQRRTNTITRPEDVAFLERFVYNPPAEVTNIYGTVEDENLQKNVEQVETQLFEEQDENQTDGQNELGSCTPTLHQDPEQIRTEHVSLETGLTCSCNSASLSNLPDVIQTDYKENYKAKNDSTM
ncbi:unnamed protein product [Pocillopora meandrina]|uniref:Uncharacterized protein n=1 Tax=Pocillopora meandrina TaxID=46732 RepID=A0AAU9XSV9_9CNID|nr:unnamed protein product [Pocillopora meandrina]